MPRYGKLVASAAVSLSLIATSTAAIGSTATPPAPSSNAWLALSTLAPSGSALLGDAAVAAAQPDTQTCADGTVIPANAACAPPPPPPPGAGLSSAPIPVLLIWAAVLGTMIYLATQNHHHHSHPNSPA
jgi:hypothetical protein